MELGSAPAGSRPSTPPTGWTSASSFGERFDRLTEQLEIITGLWATPIGETFDHAGAHYTLAGAPGLPKPVQTDAQGTPRVPIIIGGHGPTPNPGAGRPFRRRVQRRLLRLRGQHHPARPGQGRLRGRRPGSRLAGLLGRARGLRRRRRGRVPAPRARPSAGIPPRLASSPFAGTVAEVIDTIGGWAAAGVAARLPAGAGPVRTSTTSRWSARRSCRPCGTPDRAVTSRRQTGVARPSITSAPGSRPSAAPSMTIFEPRIPDPITTGPAAATAASIRIGQPVGQPDRGDPAVLHAGDLDGVGHRRERHLPHVHPAADHAVDVGAGGGQHHGGRPALLARPLAGDHHAVRRRARAATW